MTERPESLENDGVGVCTRLLCDMRCLVAITFIFLGIFISIIIVGVTSQHVSRNVDPDLSLVIVDTDMGTDDAFALMMMLEAEKRYYDHNEGRGPRVIAVTCVNGNTGVDNVVNNVLKILNVTERLDGSISVYRGASKAIMKTPSVDKFFGADGMGDVPGVPVPSLDNVNKTHAAIALVDLVSRHPGEITVMAIGPLTNIAMAIRLDEDFLKKLKHLYILGGATEGRGNTAPGVEFNFWMDPEANYIVLRDAEYSNDTITLLSWEQAEKMKISQKWRVHHLGATKSPRMKFLNEAEGISPENIEGTWSYSDPVMAAVVIRPALATHEEHLAVVPFTQGEARGAVAVDYYRSMKNATTVRLYSDIHVQQYKSMLIDYFQ